MKSTAVVQRKTSLLHKDMLLLLVGFFFRLFEAFFKGSFQSTATLVFSSDTCSLNTIISNQVTLRGSLFVFSFLVQPLPNPPSSKLLPQRFLTTKKQRTQGCVT